MAKKEDMQTKTDAELTKLLADTRSALRGMRFSAAGSRPADSSAPQKLRRVVARVLTERRARLGKTAPSTTL